MLRECPLDHRCMRGIGVGAVLDAARQDAVTSRRAVFLDRDGTLIEDVGYLDRARARRALSVDHRRDPRAEPRRPPVVVVTNQSGIARGFSPRRSSTRCTATSPRCSPPAARASTRITIVRTIRTARSTAYARRCDCRKPGRGLVDRAARELGIDPARSFVVGDKWLDVALGARGRRARRAGAHRLRRAGGSSGRPTARPPTRSSTTGRRRSSWILQSDVESAC